MTTNKTADDMTAVPKIRQNIREYKSLRIHPPLNGGIIYQILTFLLPI
jgi:hypothetical protein